LFIFETSSATPYTFLHVVFPIANTRGYCCPVQNCLSTGDLFISDCDDVQNNYNQYATILSRLLFHLKCNLQLYLRYWWLFTKYVDQSSRLLNDGTFSTFQFLSFFILIQEIRLTIKGFLFKSILVPCLSSVLNVLVCS